MAIPTSAKSRSSQSLAQLHRTSVGQAVLLILQFALGSTYEHYGAMPSEHKSLSMVHGPLLILHESVGLIILAAAIYVLRQAIGSRQRPAVIASATGLAAILAAAASGMTFLSHGNETASEVMAITTAVAMLCYLANLTVAGWAGRTRQV